MEGAPSTFGVSRPLIRDWGQAWQACTVVKEGLSLSSRVGIFCPKHVRLILLIWDGKRTNVVRLHGKGNGLLCAAPSSLSLSGFGLSFSSLLSEKCTYDFATTT